MENILKSPYSLNFFMFCKNAESEKEYLYSANKVFVLLTNCDWINQICSNQKR